MKTCKTCSHRPGNGACVNGKSENFARYMRDSDSCACWEDAACYEIYRAAMNGAETFLARVNDALDIGVVIDRDRQTNGDSFGWYRATYVTGEREQ